MLIVSLKNQQEFNLVTKLGKNFYTPYFVTIIAKKFTKLINSSSSTLFFGMKVGKKLGNAVIRNKIKRRIRHLIRLLSKKLMLKQFCWAIVIIPRKNFEKIKFATLLDELYKTITII